MLAGASVWAVPEPGVLLLTGEHDRVRARRHRARHRRLRPPGRVPRLDAPGRDDGRRRAGAREGPGRRPRPPRAARRRGPVPAARRRAAQSLRGRGRRGRRGDAPARLAARRPAHGRPSRPAGRLRPLPHARAADRVGPRDRARGGRRARAQRDDRAGRPRLGARRPRAHLRGRRGLHRLRLPPVRRPRPRARLRAARRRRRPRRRHAHDACPACSSPARRRASAARTSRCVEGELAGHAAAAHAVAGGQRRGRAPPGSDLARAPAPPRTARRLRRRARGPVRPAPRARAGSRAPTPCCAAART